MDREQTLDRLLEQWEAAQREGRPLSAAALCADAPELEATLQGRIQALEEMAGVMAVDESTDPDRESGPGADGPARPLQLGPSVTRYEPIEHHASGGLGEVYRVRDDQFGREVALKRIRPGQAHRTVASRRFDREIQISGRLEHPGIVPIYGRGLDEQGHAYYTMRLIRGETLSRAIERLHRADAEADAGDRRVALRALLTRFVTVCQTIAYAHSQRIVHRDLKPDNIMLGPFGETLVVDWGLARPFDAPADDDAAAPLVPDATGALSLGTVGTPRYMSPEQAEGRTVGPASDIYSLGGNLYCLLTAHPPIEGDSLGAILEAVRAGRIVRPRVWRPELPAALEAVCLKALALRPEDRYGTAQALAGDIERWLADEPVRARPEPWPERARRWARRHRTAMAAAAAGLLMAVLGLGAVTVVQTRARQQLSQKADQLTDANGALNRQRNRAEDREGQAIAAVEKFRDAVVNEPALKDSLELAPLRGRLLREPIAFFQGLRAQLQADHDTRPASLERLADASFALGLLVDELGEKDRALTLIREARTIQEGLARDDPGNRAHQADLAASLNSIGNLLSEIGRLPEALEAYQAAADTMTALVALPTATDHDRANLAACHNNIGVLLRSLGRGDPAFQSYSAARSIQEPLVAAHPDVARYRVELASTLVNLGVLLHDAGHDPQALQAYRQGQALLAELVREQPEVTLHQASLAIAHDNIGNALSSLGQPAESLAAHEAAHAIHQALVAAHPSTTEFQTYLARNHALLGTRLAEAGRRDEALASFEAAVAIHRRLVDANPTVAELQNHLAKNYSEIGDFRLEAGQNAEALAAYAQARPIRETLVREHPETPDFASSLGALLNNSALAELEDDRPEAARTRLQQAIAWQRKALAINPQDPTYREFLANHLRSLIRAARALDREDEARDAEQALARLEAGDPEPEPEPEPGSP